MTNVAFMPVYYLYKLLLVLSSNDTKSLCSCFCEFFISVFLSFRIFIFTLLVLFVFVFCTSLLCAIYIFVLCHVQSFIHCHFIALKNIHYNYCQFMVVGLPFVFWLVTLCRLCSQSLRYDVTAPGYKKTTTTKNKQVII